MYKQRFMYTMLILFLSCASTDYCNMYMYDNLYNCNLLNENILKFKQYVYIMHTILYYFVFYVINMLNSVHLFF